MGPKNVRNKDDFDKIVREIMFPVFPLLADTFLQKSGIAEGVCLDIGTGNGYLGLALAGKSNLRVHLVDVDPGMLKYAEENIRERRLSGRVDTVRADVEALPFPDNYARLIVSRGSVFFWENQVEGFNEIYRVLAPGGMTFIGGGFATAELMAEVGAKMKAKNPGWEKHLEKNIGPDAPGRFRQILRECRIPEPEVEVSYDAVNLWVMMRKQKREPLER